ncbi:MAG: hypothetical protein SH848_19050 [Saprospiraceae bacterium]|nr:hypothetical protein [Saprospiraceae bacterium]MDZ4706033.1 hypothetical protein [Saprospiraceae bacterium]
MSDKTHLLFNLLDLLRREPSRAENGFANAARHHKQRKQKKTERPGICRQWKQEGY